jgi:hypothetical protein
VDRRLIPLLALAAALLWLTPAAEVAGKRRPAAVGSGHFRRAPIQRALPGPGQVQVGRFLSGQGLPRGGRAHGQVGDYFVRSRRMLAVVRARDGALVDLALARPGQTPRFVDQLGWAKVRVCDGQGAHEVVLRRVRLLTGRAGSGLQILGEVNAGGAPLEVTTTYSLTPDGQHLALVTRLRNRGGAARRNVGVCDHLGTGNARLQLPGLGEVRKPGSHRARSCGRSEGGLSTILAVPAAQPPMLLSFKMWPPPGAFDPNLEPDYGRHDLQPRGVVTVRRFLVLARGGYHLALARAWRLSAPRVKLRAPLQQVRVWPPDRRVPGSRVVVRSVTRSGASSRPLLLTGLGRGPDAKQTLSLPPRGGPYTASLLVPGVGEGPGVKLPLRATAPQTVRLVAPPMGSLKLTVRAAGKPGPVKLLLEGLGTTRRPDLGGGGGQRAANVIYSVGGDEEVALAPGTYRVTATRGPTYTLATKTVLLRGARTTSARLSLRELLTAPGWIAADLHTHGSASYDSPTSPRARVVAARAVGLGLLVASEHNAVNTALGPAAKQLGWGDALLVLPGQEVTTEGDGFGHFNVFPLPANGRLAWSATTPAALFAAARRARARGGPTPLIQVNHPRMGSLGYFHQLGLDPTTGRARAPGYRGDFDLLEVFNGDDLDQLASVLRNVREWFALLNLGLRYTATAGSDAHRLPYQDVGYPRNMIRWRSDAADKQARPQQRQILAALRAGRSYITTGPLVEFTARGEPLGALVKVIGTKPVPLRVTLRAAPWIDVGKLQLWANGKLVRTLALVHRRGLRRPPLVRLQRTLRVSPRVDTWYVVTAQGGSPDPTQQRKVLPFVLTNPIFVDADGDGVFTAINAKKKQKKKKK